MHPFPTRLRRLTSICFTLALMLLASAGSNAHAQGLDIKPDRGPIDAEASNSIGWLVLQGELRQGPVREAWVAPADADPSLQTVLEQIRRVQEGEQYTGLVVYMDMPALSATEVDAIHDALLELRESDKHVIAFAQYYSMADYIIASAADTIALQHNGMVELTGMHIQEMYMAGLMEMLGIQPNLIQIGRYKGASEAIGREGPSDAWSQNIDALLDGMYLAMLERVGEARDIDADDFESMMGASLTLDAEGLIDAGIIDVLCDREMTEVLEDAFGEDFAWDTEMGLGGDDAMAQAMAENPLVMLSALFEEPVITTDGPTIVVIHASGAIISGDSSYGEGLFGAQAIGARTVDQMLYDALYDDNVEGVVLRLDSPGGSALASEVIWQAVEAFAHEKPIVCSVGGMAASGGYYIASACDQIYVEPRSILGSIGVVAGKLNLEGLFDMVGINVHTRSRGPNAALLSPVDNFTEQEREQIEASMQIVYDLFRERVTTGRGDRLDDLDAVDEGLLFTGGQAVDNGMADELGGVDEAIAYVADQTDLEPGDYDVMHLPHPVSLATYLESMFSDGGMPMGMAAPQHTVALTAARQLVGEAAWTQITRTLYGITLLRQERVLVLMPQAIVVE